MYAAFAPKGADSRPLFAWTGATADDALLMWGWEPELTAYAGLRSADRASIGEYLIRPNNGRTYFRDRLLKDLPRTNPAIVIDAAREGYFFNNDPNYKPEAATLQSFPELYATVSERLRAGRRGRALRGDLPSARQGRGVARGRNSVAKFAAGPGHQRGDGEVRRLVGPGASPNATAELTVAPAQPVGGAVDPRVRRRSRRLFGLASIAGRPRRGSDSFRQAARRARKSCGYTIILTGRSSRRPTAARSPGSKSSRSISSARAQRSRPSRPSGRNGEARWSTRNAAGHRQAISRTERPQVRRRLRGRPRWATAKTVEFRPNTDKWNHRGDGIRCR